MSDVINLKQFRKRKTRDDKARLADENRIRFGRTKVEKVYETNKLTQDARFLEQNQRELKNDALEPVTSLNADERLPQADALSPSSDDPL